MDGLAKQLAEYFEKLETLEDTERLKEYPPKRLRLGYAEKVYPMVYPMRCEKDG